MKIGVLALQGAFIEHKNVLARLGIPSVEVRLPEHLTGLDGLIIPGGESTTIGLLAQKWGLLEPLRAFARSGRPIWGTCAGMILMAREVVDGLPNQPILELMDITVRRNAFGRQVDSFEADLPVPVLGDPPFHAVFIRAPLVERVGARVDVLASLEDGTAVAVRQGHMLATAFHPELTGDVRFHRYFLQLTG
ncbi:MAG: pyridoxal 5'-phosphate synthase glutaminase subunit PdxT [Anaerolineae bacterium]|nr:pyridoxal 5'-phosphate synthase glutaminase subunit PdxT [Anaerolineae bacterium]MDW8068247.1 pyridoxal 5'-phosphate synthase glutaminase subunit PdxT [Anaerolineae bacterium]